jgi:hypothetical protein
VQSQAPPSLPVTGGWSLKTLAEKLSGPWHREQIAKPQSFIESE